MTIFAMSSSDANAQQLKRAMTDIKGLVERVEGKVDEGFAQVGPGCYSKLHFALASGL